MKPPKFEYHDPETVDAALALLSEHGDEGKVLAGGQSLVPLLNFRLAYPEHLIDVNRVSELDYLQTDDGSLRIGAMCRQTTLKDSEEVASGWPLLTEAMEWVAHPQIRNRGTVGGSVAHADPAAELPVALSVLDTKLHVKSTRGERTLEPSEFFRTHLTTAMEPDELLTEIEIGAPPTGSAYAFEEFARRHGDFALGGAAVMLTMEGRKCASASIALLSAAPTPVRATGAEEALVGKEIDEEVAKAAGDATSAAVDPTGDIHASADYRKHLLGVMVRRGIMKAVERAS